MSEQNKPPPIVFISYSHDSREHKAWVATLAARLRDKGVDVILDQWDTEPGDDLRLFMEQGVTKADRVLMICTEAYTRKVDDGKGGAGYEAMIVTGELIKNQGLNKFIPIIRQTAKEHIIPNALRTRFYLDLSDDQNFEEHLESLLETIHRVIHSKKPPLGPNPFENIDLRSAETKEADRLIAAQYSQEVEDPLIAYETAKKVIANHSLGDWRRLVGSLQKNCAERLLKWKTEHGSEFPRQYDERNPLPLYNYAVEGIKCYEPLLGCLLAAAESGEKEYAGMLSWVDMVLKPRGWERNGYTVVVEFPRTILYVLHMMVGAMLMRQEEADEAIRLAATPIELSYKEGETKPLYLSTDITGWTETFHHYCTAGWGFTGYLIDNRTWLEQVFGSKEELLVGRVAYYMLLSFLEFCFLARTADENLKSDSWRFEVPLNFCEAPSEVLKPAYQLFLRQRDILKQLLERNGIDRRRLDLVWPVWIEATHRWIGEVYRWSSTTVNYPKRIYRKICSAIPTSWVVSCLAENRILIAIV